MEGIRTCEGVGQGSFTFGREFSGKSQGISETSGYGNHVHAYTVEALVSGTLRTRKRCLYLELAACRNVKIQSLYWG